VILVLLAVITFPAVLRPMVRGVMRRARGAVPSDVWPDQAFGVRWLGLYAVSWILQGGAFWMLGMSLGGAMDGLLGLSVYPAAYLLGYLAVFAPAGAGVREGFLILFLDPILGAGAAILAVVARLWATLVELLPALVLVRGYLKSSRGEGQGEGRG
jgi:hypothetical protein